MSMPKPKRTTLPIDKVIANPRNDNVHPQSQIDLLVESIRHFGQPRPILVRTHNRMIIAGHGVHQAMREAGEDKIEVDLWDVDQKTADAFLVADNRFTELSRTDSARRRSILEMLGDDFDFEALGFTDSEVADILADETEIDILEIDTEPVDDTFWISVRGPLAKQDVVLKRLQDVMAEFEGLEVDLGTTVG